MELPMFATTVTLSTPLVGNTVVMAKATGKWNTKDEWTLAACAEADAVKTAKVPEGTELVMSWN
jgi:hypothetical protein